MLTSTQNNMMETVQVLLLATGETDKLPPLTLETPTPMLSLVDRPLLVYAIELLARQNIKKAWVSLYHLAGNVEAYLGQGQRWGVALDYLLQREAWGTAGALKWAQSAINQTVVVLPGDAIVDLDIAEIVACHRQNQSVATVVVHRQGGDNSSIVSLDAAKQLTVTEGESWYSTGVYVFETAVFAHIPERTPFDIHTELLPTLMAAGIPVHACEMHGYWNSLTTFQAYQDAQRHILNSAWGNEKALNGFPLLKHPALAGNQIAPGIWVGRNHIIDPSVRILPPVYIGQNCQVGADVELGPEVAVGSFVVIDDEATVCHSTILDHTYVGQLVNIDSRLVDKNIVVDFVTSKSTVVVDQFLLDEAQNNIIDNQLLRMWEFLLALLLLLVTLIVTVPLSLALLVTSGHVFQRVARAGNKPTAPPFHLWRFYTRKRNGRYAFLGRWLERWEGHRLPELANVLHGDLHLVGVKALSAADMAQITETWQQKRNEYAPGFTGTWFLQTNPDSNLDDILIADAYYVATRSWREDIRILKQTPSAWRRRSKSGRKVMAK